MRQGWGTTLMVGMGVGLFLAPQLVLAQACKDEVSMLEGSTQSLVELIDTVKKETLPVFEQANHQKSAVNRLSVHTSMLAELVTCLEQAAKDTTATKEQAEAAKTQHDAAVKLLEVLKNELSAIKDAKASKDAKALIEKLDMKT